MGIWVTLVPVELVRLALKVLLAYLDTKAERVNQEMLSLPGQVLLAHLASVGPQGKLACLEPLETQDHQVSKAQMDDQAIKESQVPRVTLDPLASQAYHVLNVT